MASNTLDYIAHFGGVFFSYTACTVVVVLILRKAFHFEKFITIDNIELVNKLMLIASLVVSFSFLNELFVSWYSGYMYEQFAFYNRALGPYWWSYFMMLIANIILPLLFAFRKIRRNVVFTFVISLAINFGMFFERFVIMIISLHRDYLPSSWEYH